ncbi:MAG TPA: YegS/Rv2252/BmrU family lipid kinase [Candidatus Sulfomarinibacteraceae bacterium]|nr:YegS/Rv2252/BmrU family lipid kinase [Candidatus Sulfomarinibacteraceae bacterium]
MQVIVNPAAAGGRLGREWPSLERRLRGAGHELEVTFTEAPGHATELAARAVAGGARRVVVAGGDGSVCEAAEGLAGGGCELAILPLGTGNDAARTFGIPLALEDAAAVAAGGAVRAVDLIRVGDRLVLNAIGIGLTADINHRAARVKWVRGIAVYLATAAVSLVSFRAPRVRVVADGQDFASTMTILAVHNGPTTGGGFRLTPDAEPDDALLDATLVPDVPLSGRLQRLVGALRGTLHTMDGSVSLQAPFLELHHTEALAVHLDGNQARLEPPVTRFEVVPSALKVVVPQSQ